MRPCPKCESAIPEDAAFCRYCRSTLNHSVAEAQPATKFSTSPSESPYSRPRGARSAPVGAWELWVVVALQVLVIGTQLKYGKVVPAVVGLLILLGLVRRSTLTWWIVTFCNALAGVGYLIIAEGETRNFVIAGLNFLVAGLLVSCKLRGAYSPSMD